jgi:hypothetical protein
MLRYLLSRVPTPNGGEYARYIRITPHHDFDNVRKCLLLLEQQRDYLNLSKIALDVRSILAMSASIERLFSSADITYKPRTKYKSKNGCADSA